MSRHVAVLYGGLSSEREVSLVSGAACADALERRGFRVTRIDAGRDLATRLEETAPDVVFNALHGRPGEDGTVQGLMDVLGYRYTHSGVLASALAMDKPLAKVLFEAAGMRCPEGRVGSLREVLDAALMAPPYVVKPAAEGSSLGVYIVLDGEPDELRQRNDWPYGGDLLVERYIPGRELTVAVLEGQAMAVTEIRPEVGFYDFRAKYSEGYARHVVPAELPDEITAICLDWAERAHAVLGCRGVSRADFRYDESQGADGIYLLEVNTQPGMTPMSLVPEQAAHRGIAFDDLVVRLVEIA